MFLGTCLTETNLLAEKQFSTEIIFGMTNDTDTKLEELDQEFHEYRVLRDGTDVTADVAAVGVEENEIFVHLLIGENKSATVAFSAKRYEHLRALDRLHDDLDLEFTADLSVLEGKVLTVQFLDEDFEELLIREGGIEIRSVSTTKSEVKKLYPILNEQYTVGYRRLKWFKKENGDTTAAQITQLRAEHDALVLTFDLCNEPVEYTIPTPDEIAGSKYERVVEEVGQGSVKQIEGEYLYAVWDKNQATPQDYNSPTDPIAHVSDRLSHWWLFSNKKEAEEARVNVFDPGKAIQVAENKVTTVSAKQHTRDVSDNELERSESISPFILLLLSVLFYIGSFVLFEFINPNNLGIIGSIWFLIMIVLTLILPLIGLIFLLVILDSI